MSFRKRGQCGPTGISLPNRLYLLEVPMHFQRDAHRLHVPDNKLAIDLWQGQKVYLI
jgi:hypothetical protein